MSGEQKSYLENQLEAVAEKTDAGYTFTFQREKIKLALIIVSVSCTSKPIRQASLFFNFFKASG